MDGRRGPSPIPEQRWECQRRRRRKPDQGVRGKGGRDEGWDSGCNGTRGLASTVSRGWFPLTSGKYGGGAPGPARDTQQHRHPESSGSELERMCGQRGFSGCAFKYPPKQAALLLLRQTSQDGKERRIVLRVHGSPYSGVEESL